MIEDGKRVKMHFSLKIDGNIIEDTFQKQPFEFHYGTDKVIPGIEDHIKGLCPGDKRTFAVHPPDAFGDRDPESVISVDREQFPSKEVKPGMMVTSQAEDGDTSKGIVIATEGDRVIVDFNHPLAGKVLQFEIEILEVY